MKKTNFLWKEPITSWDKNDQKQGMMIGRISGFDLVDINLVGTDYVLTISHSTPNFINSDGTLGAGIGNFISPQGVQHLTDESIEITIPSNTSNNTRRDIIYAELEYILTAGNPNLPTYGSKQGVSSINLPPVDFPKKQIILSWVNIKGIGSGGTMSAGDITFEPMQINSLGMKSTAVLKKKDVSPIINQADNVQELGIISAKHNIVATLPSGDPTDNAVNNRPVLVLSGDQITERVIITHSGAVPPNPFITDLVIKKDKYRTDHDFDQMSDFEGVEIEIYNGTNFDIKLGVPQGVTTANSSLLGYNNSTSKQYILKSNTSVKIRRIKTVYGFRFWAISDFAEKTRVVGDPDTEIITENYIYKSKTIQENLEILDVVSKSLEGLIGDNAYMIGENEDDINTNSNNINSNTIDIAELKTIIHWINTKQYHIKNNVNLTLRTDIGNFSVSDAIIHYSLISTPNEKLSSSTAQVGRVQVAFQLYATVRVNGNTSGGNNHIQGIYVDNDFAFIDYSVPLPVSYNFEFDPDGALNGAGTVPNPINVVFNGRLNDSSNEFHDVVTGFALKSGSYNHIYLDEGPYAPRLRSMNNYHYDVGITVNGILNMKKKP